MFWELIATITAGMGAAGIALCLRIFLTRLPKWIIPASAGLGMLLFQIYSEYNWYPHTKSQLPQGSTVVAEVSETAPYRPWSYAKPQITRFIAVDAANRATVDAENRIVQANLYFFERRQPAKTLPVLADCRNGVQAEALSQNGRISAQAWGKTAYTDKLIAAVCR